jgi:hypothetical protein
MATKKKIIFSRGFLLIVYVFCLFISIPIFLIPSNANAGNEELYGTWRLISMTRQLIATGETSDLLGKAPQGFINYGPDGRVLVIITAEKRPKPAVIEKMTDQERVELFKTVVAYGGTYKYDGKTVTHHIDISWNENWTGTSQVRNVKLEGHRLILTTNPAPSAVDGKLQTAVLTWEKVN